MANTLGKIPLIVNSLIKEVNKKENLKVAADAAIDHMKKRTRLGKGVKEPEGKTTSLKKLEPSTVEIRKSLRKQGKLTGPGATPGKSGINRTGKTLESLNTKALDGSVTIQLDQEGERVASELIKIDKDFTFMNLSKVEVKTMTEILEKAVATAAKKL
jgi:hypothetical protein